MKMIGVFGLLMGFVAFNSFAQDNVDEVVNKNNVGCPSGTCPGSNASKATANADDNRVSDEGGEVEKPSKKDSKSANGASD